MRVSHLAIGGVVLVLIGAPILIFLGLLAIPSFEIPFLGWKTPSLNQRAINEQIDAGLATAAGFTPAKNPTEAMDKFKEAIHARKYKFAAIYCTKSYAEMLERSHDNAVELGTLLDKIRNWGDNKKILSDKTKIALHSIDPFPTNFKSGTPPKQDGDKAYATYEWEKVKLENPGSHILEEVKQMDVRMFQNVLSSKAFNGKIEIVKVGEDWKLNIPVTPVWEAEVAHFNEQCKTYVTGLNGFWTDINREVYDSKGKFESEFLGKLRAAK